VVTLIVKISMVHIFMPIGTISELKTELQGALVDLGHKNAFNLLLKEA
jgi:hypothetical protein